MSARNQRRLAALPWLIWLLGASLYSYGFFQRVAPSVMVEDLMREFAVTAALLGHLSAFYFYAYAGLQIPLGVLLDRLGPRRVMTASALTAATGSLLFAVAHDLPVAYLGRFLIGAGVAVGLIGSLKLIMVWFPARRFATVAGLTTLVGTLGGVTAQAPLAAAVEAVGWRPLLVGAAGIGLVLAALLWLVVRDATTTDAPAARAAAPRARAGLKTVLANRQIWLLGAISGLVGGPSIALASLWGVPYAMTTYGITRPVAGGSMSVLLVGMALGGPLVGWISDAISLRKPPVISSAAVCLVAWLFILFVPAPPMPLVNLLLFILGLATGGFIVNFALARELNAPSLGGTAVGVVNTMVISSVALMQPLVGTLLDVMWDGRMEAGIRVYDPAAFHAAFLALPVCAAVGLVLCLFLRESYARQQVGAEPGLN